MKRMLFISGTMEVGKTTISKKLLKELPNSVFLDGDWCWDMNPFIVNEENKAMVVNNICYLLNSFIRNTSFQNIIFCWVMNKQEIVDTIKEKLVGQFNFYNIILTISEKKLKEHYSKDIKEGIRENKIDKSLRYLKDYENIIGIKIEVKDDIKEIINTTE